MGGLRFSISNGSARGNGPGRRVRPAAVLLSLAVLLTAVAGGCPRIGARPAPRGDGTTLPGGQRVVRAMDLFPTIEGTQWDYAGEGNEFAPYQAEVGPRDGDRILIFTTTTGARVAWLYELREQDDRVVLLRTTEIDEIPDAAGAQELLRAEAQDPRVILAGPIQTGASWRDREGGATHTIQAIDDTVEVPAGRFAGVIRIRVQNPDGADSIKHYTPGIGLVKNVFNPGPDEVVQELRRFSLGDGEGGG